MGIQPEWLFPYFPTKPTAVAAAHPARIKHIMNCQHQNPPKKKDYVKLKLYDLHILTFFLKSLPNHGGTGRKNGKGLSRIEQG